MELFILLLVLINIGLCKDCLDSDGNNVDYWFILKLPKNNKNKPKLSGWEYFYCDANNDCKKLIAMTDKLGDSSTALQRTVAQIKFDGSDDEMSIIWQDQPFPHFESSNKAHSKGMMTASSLTKDGFIINHSLPNFPVFDEYPPKNKKILPGMPKSGSNYAQHFFCVSLGIDEIEKLASQYKIAQIIIHLSQFPEKDFEYPNILSLKMNDKSYGLFDKATEQKFGQESIKSKGGLEIQVFSTQQGKQASVIIPTGSTKVDDKLLGKKRAHPDSEPESSEIDEEEVPAHESKKKKLDTKKLLSINKQNHNLRREKHSFLEISSLMHDPDDVEMEIVSSESSEEEIVEIKNKGFFADIVAPGLGSNIVMSTWGKGRIRLQGAVCQKLQSLSAEYRQHKFIYDSEEIVYKFKYTKEHSKFGISFGDDKKWIIIADLNRQLLQKSRGGTALCFQNTNLWAILNEVLVDRQECP